MFDDKSETIQNQSSQTQFNQPERIFAERVTWKGHTAKYVVLEVDTDTTEHKTRVMLEVPCPGFKAIQDFEKLHLAKALCLCDLAWPSVK